MSNEPQTPWYSGIQKKYALFIGACVALVVFALAWFICSMQYENRRRDILELQQESMTSWVKGTVGAVTLWAEGLEAQAKRVSGSDLYRLFASELSQMDERTASLINLADSGITLPEDAFYLAEEVPLIRSVLLDFMNYSGLLDARIVNPNGQTILSALVQPTPISPAQKKVVDYAIFSGRMGFSPARSSASGLVLDAADPLRAFMLDEGAERSVATVLITTPITGQVAQFLARDLRQHLLAHIIQKNGEAWEEVQVQSLAPVPLDSTISSAISPNVGDDIGFRVRPGLNGEMNVYSLGGKVPGMDWWVVLEIPEAEVNRQLRAQGLLIFGIGALIGLGVVLGLALLWWILVGHQQKIIADRFRELYLLIDRQKKLLDSVNLSLDVGLFMSDTNGNILIGNRAFAEIAHTDEQDLAKNTLTSLFDAKVAGNLLDHIRTVADSEHGATVEVSLAQPDGNHLYRVTLYPFEDSDTTDDFSAHGAVAIMQDITEFRRSSEKRRLQQMHTMDAFVKAVEGVDPYLLGHSRKMAALGDLVAQRMGMSEADRNTISMAASLSQVGKLFVPRELLTKTGKLTPEEQAEMNKVPGHAYRVLKDIDFELPVADAVHEMYERMDGAGYPGGKKGDEINIYARILSVANAFCAMVSPRSYRAGMPVENAVKNLRNDIGGFDHNLIEQLEGVLKTPEGMQTVMQDSFYS